jgi:hypothetical protein
MQVCGTVPPMGAYQSLRFSITTAIDDGPALALQQWSGSIKYGLQS